jgi:hypothetical protein
LLHVITLEVITFCNYSAYFAKSAHPVIIERFEPSDIGPQEAVVAKYAGGAVKKIRKI